MPQILNAKGPRSTVWSLLKSKISSSRLKSLNIDVGYGYEAVATVEELARRYLLGVLKSHRPSGVRRMLP